MSERGVIDGTIPTIAPHPNFRCFVFLRFFAFFFFLLPNSRFRKKMTAVSQYFGILNAVLFAMYCSDAVCLARKKTAL